MHEGFLESTRDESAVVFLLDFLRELRILIIEEAIKDANASHPITFYQINLFSNNLIIYLLLQSTDGFEQLTYFIS